VFGSILPPTPRKPKSGRLVKKLLTALFILLVALGMLGGLGAYGVIWTRELLDARALFASGAKAEVLNVEGTQRSRNFLFNEYDLTLTYADEQGEKHTAKEDFVSVFQSVDDGSRVEIRYDPKNPDHAVSSWGLDVEVGRWIWCVFSFLIAGVGGFTLFAAGKAFRDAFVEQRAAREGIEVTLVVNETGRDQHGNVTYKLEVEPKHGDKVTGIAVLNGASPLWLGERAALGLLLEDRRRIFLVESDGQPVDLDLEAQKDMRERAEIVTRGG
jgi:hypothetical protein